MTVKVGIIMGSQSDWPTMAAAGEILDELGNDELSAVRFQYTTKLRRTDEPYSLEYVIFARGKDGKIHEIAESMDTLGSANLFAGKPKDLNPYIGKSSS